MRETENNKRYKAAMQGVGMQNVKNAAGGADKGSLQVNVTSSVNHIRFRKLAFRFRIPVFRKIH